VSWLMSDRFESLSRIGQVSVPLLVMSGEADQVIDPAQGRRLFEVANEPKQGFWPREAGHNNIFDLGGFDAARAFIESYFGPQRAG